MKNDLAARFVGRPTKYSVPWPWTRMSFFWHSGWAILAASSHTTSQTGRGIQSQNHFQGWWLRLHEDGGGGQHLRMAWGGGTAAS